MLDRRAPRRVLPVELDEAQTLGLGGRAGARDRLRSPPLGPLLRSRSSHTLSATRNVLAAPSALARGAIVARSVFSIASTPASARSAAASTGSSHVSARAASRADTGKMALFASRGTAAASRARSSSRRLRQWGWASILVRARRTVSTDLATSATKSSSGRDSGAVGSHTNSTAVAPDRAPSAMAVWAGMMPPIPGVSMTVNLDSMATSRPTSTPRTCAARSPVTH